MTDLFGNPDPIIRVLDFEATGLEPDAEIVEVGYTDFNAATREVGATSSYLCRVAALPPGGRAVHHIRMDEVRGLPPYDRRCLFEQAVADGVYAWAAHNASFEERFVMGHLPMFCTYKAALRHWPDAPGHGVFALLYMLEDEGAVTIDHARAQPSHRAGPDSYATALLLKAMLDDGVTGRAMQGWSAEPRIFARCPIGQYRDRPWREVDHGFLQWILNRIDDPDIRFNASLEIERRRDLNA